MDDVIELHERVTLDESEISSLRVQIDRECIKRLELRHKVWCLEKDLERHKGDVEELKADAERQCDRYNELWRAQGDLLIEAQALRSQVSILSSGSRAESTSGWLEGMSGRTGGVSG